MRHKTIRFLFSITFFIILADDCTAQHQAPVIEWQKCFGGSWMDNSGSIVHTLDGGYIIAGSTSSYDGDVIGHHRYDSIAFDLWWNVRYDIWIVKLDSLGSIQWQKCLGGSEADGAGEGTYLGFQSIIQTSDGGYAIAGETASNDGDVSGNHGGIDGWVVKMDRSGNIQWQKCLGGTGDDAFSTLIETPEKGYIAVGYTTSRDGDVSGKHTGSHDSSSDVWVVKLNSLGNLEWQKCFGGTAADEATAVIPTSDHNYIVAGTTRSNDGDVSGLHRTYDADNWLVKITGDGNLIWQKCFGGRGLEELESIIQTADNGFLFAGLTTSNDGDVSGLHDSLSGEADAWIVKLDSSANIEWQKCIGSQFWERAYSAIQVSDGGYIIAASTNANGGNVSGYHELNDQNTDCWIVKLSASGQIEWENCYGGTAADWPTTIVEVPGGYTFIGTTSSSDDDVFGHHAHEDIWVVKLRNVENGVQDSDPAKEGISVYPNPAQTEVHFSINSKSLSQSIEFYDILGRQYFPKYTIENNAFSCNVRELPSGIYLARFHSSELSYGIASFMVQH